MYPLSTCSLFEIQDLWFLYQTVVLETDLFVKANATEECENQLSNWLVEKALSLGYSSRQDSLPVFFFFFDTVGLKNWIHDSAKRTGHCSLESLHTCTHADCTHAHTRTRRHARTRAHAYAVSFPAISLSISLCVCVCVCARVRVCLSLSFSLARARARAHTHTHTHTHGEKGDQCKSTVRVVCPIREPVNGIESC